MSVNDFLTKQNVLLIWEVIMDDVLKNKSQEIILKINNIFNSNLQGFFENEKHKSRNVMELNKKYISLIINYIDGNFSQRQKQQIPIQKYEKELITHDDLQSDRMSQFDNKLNTIKQDFLNAMALPVPEKPDFGDKLDEPLTELEIEIKKVMAQRNYDIEQINRNNQDINSNTNANTNWLKSQETSIKNEKVNPLQQKLSIKLQSQQQQQQQKIKYIKIDDNELSNGVIQNDVIDIDNNNNNDNNYNSNKILSPKKQVSWNNNNIEYENNSEDDFFKKLKTIKPSNESQFVSNNNINNNNNTTTNEINSMKEELKIFNVKLENLTQNVNAILDLLKQQKTINNL